MYQFVQLDILQYVQAHSKRNIVSVPYYSGKSLCTFSFAGNLGSLFYTGNYATYKTYLIFRTYLWY